MLTKGLFDTFNKNSKNVSSSLGGLTLISFDFLNVFIVGYPSIENELHIEGYFVQGIFKNFHLILIDLYLLASSNQHEILI